MPVTDFLRRPHLVLVAVPAAWLSAWPIHAQPMEEKDQGMYTTVAHACSVTRSNGVMAITTEGHAEGAALEVIPARPSPEGPTELRFRMRTSVTGELGEYIVYHEVEGANPLKAFDRIPFRPDGAWHDYRLPLAAGGRVNRLKFTFGVQPHRLELAGVEVVPAPELPEEVARLRAGLPAEVRVEAHRLSLALDVTRHRYTVHDARTGRTWMSEPVSPWLVLVKAEMRGDATLAVELYDRFANAALSAGVVLGEGGKVRFSLEPVEADVPINAARFFPPRLSTDMADGQVVFCDRSCGVLLDQQDPTYNHWPLRVYGNTHCLDMPWVGVFDDVREDGVLLLIETPADAEVALVPDQEGRHWPETRWLPSMDRFRYRRVASYRFTENGRHVGLARAYRGYLRETGRFKTLAEKAADKPDVERLRGAPSLWGARYPTKWIRQMRPLGITRGIVNTCTDPGLIDWLNQQGYLTGRYDSYTDFVEGLVGFQKDTVPDAAVQSRPGGGPKLGWLKRSGEQMYWRSSALWPAAEASYVPQELNRLPYNARFIDVAAAGELLEDFFPGRAFDRRQDLENRRALFRRMNDRGLVLGTEHGNDWVIDLVEYFEGSMSGPFWWSSWPAGHLDRPRRDQLTPEYLKYGMGYANRVPLWELVYHDCAVTTWYWGDTAGLLYEAAPELADRKDLFNLLYGTTPLFWMNGTGYRFPQEQHRMLRTFHDTCPLHEVVAFEAMLEHRFVSEDRAVQRTRFANGTDIVVNFSDEPRPCRVEGGNVLLAPQGYHVRGPGFSQTRLWVNGAARTIIAGDGYLTVHGDGRDFVAGVKSSARLTTFQVSDSVWNLFVDPDAALEVNIPEVTGWESGDVLQVRTMDDLGALRRAVATADDRGVVRFTSTENVWRFALVRGS
jgi:hypothetical protein